MKITFLFLIVFALTISQHHCKIKPSDVIAAINGLLRNFYVNNDRRVDILCFQCDKNLLEMANEIAKSHQSEKISFRTIARNKTSLEEEKNRILENSTVVIFRNVKDFLVFNKTAAYKDEFSSNNPHHVIYIRDKMKIDFSFNHTYVYNYFLIGNGASKQLSLATIIVPKNKQKKCPMMMTAINRFNNTAKKWEINIFFPKKFNNWNFCILDFAFSNTLNSVHWEKDKLTKKFSLAGPLFWINDAITRKLKITDWYYHCKLENIEEMECLNTDVKPVALIESRYVLNLRQGPYVNLQFFNFELYNTLFIPPGCVKNAIKIKFY
jgi:hypothetical protein